MERAAFLHLGVFAGLGPAVGYVPVGVVLLFVHPLLALVGVLFAYIIAIVPAVLTGLATALAVRFWDLGWRTFTVSIVCGGLTTAAAMNLGSTPLHERAFGTSLGWIWGSSTALVCLAIAGRDLRFQKWWWRGRRRAGPDFPLHKWAGAAALVFAGDWLAAELADWKPTCTPVQTLRISVRGRELRVPTSLHPSIEDLDVRQSPSGKVYCTPRKQPLELSTLWFPSQERDGRIVPTSLHLVRLQRASQPPPEAPAPSTSDGFFVRTQYKGRVELRSIQPLFFGRPVELTCWEFAGADRCDFRARTPAGFEVLASNASPAPDELAAQIQELEEFLKPIDGL